MPSSMRKGDFPSIDVEGLTRVEDAACGCPRYDLRPGIRKIHNGKCAEATAKKAAPRAANSSSSKSTRPTKAKT